MRLGRLHGGEIGIAIPALLAALAEANDARDKAVASRNMAIAEMSEWARKTGARDATIDALTSALAEAEAERDEARADLECRTFERDASEEQMNAVCDALGMASDDDADDAPGVVGGLREDISSLTSALGKAKAALTDARKSINWYIDLIHEDEADDYRRKPSVQRGFEPIDAALAAINEAVGEAYNKPNPKGT